MAQSLSNTLLHIIYSTKNREPYIDCDIEQELHSYMISVYTTHGSYVHAIGGIEDHIHSLVTLPRTISISNLLEETKKVSSKWMKTKGNKYEKFSWQKGYGVFTVSESQKCVVSKYILNQKKHHEGRTFQEEYRSLLQLNNVPFDERYVWD